MPWLPVAIAAAAVNDAAAEAVSATLRGAGPEVTGCWGVCVVALGEGGGEGRVAGDTGSSVTCGVGPGSSSYRDRARVCTRARCEG